MLQIIKIMLPALLIWVTGPPLAGQVTLRYQVYKNASCVGELNVSRLQSGSRITYKLDSDIKTSLVVAIQFKSIEESVYDKGILVQSSVYRTLNGNKKAHYVTTLNDQNYQLTRNGQVSSFRQYPIRHNLLSLFCQEPDDFHQVYSDKFQRLVPLEKISEHRYKIIFPDGSSNEYYYQRGVCKIVILQTKIMKLKLVLTEVIKPTC